MEGLKFSLWEKYGKRRIYINGSYDNAFLYPNKDGIVEPSRPGAYYLDSFLFDELDEALHNIGIKLGIMSFDEVVETLIEKNLLK